MAMIQPLVSPAGDPSHAVPVPVVLSAIGRAATRLLAEALEPTGLKPRHIVVLAALRDRPQTQSALGEASGVDPTKLVGLLNDLEEAGLVTRKRDPADRRRHNVAISELGRARLAAVDAATQRVEQRFVAGLDPAQRAYLEALLSHMTANAGLSPCGADALDADG